MAQIRFAELAERGMEPRLEEVLSVLIGDRMSAPGWLNLTPVELAALGYGRPCECGERGLEPGEAACTYPGCEDDTCDDV